MSDRRNRDIGRRRAYQARGGRWNCKCWYCSPSVRRQKFLQILMRLRGEDLDSA